MELIQKWLSGSRNFIVGAILYKKFGTDKDLKKLFGGKKDPYLQKKLEEALAGLLEQPKVILQESPKAPEADEMPDSSDPVLKAIRNEWVPLYQKMNYLRHHLDTREGNSPEDIAFRRPIAHDILELEQKCMHIWDKRSYYLKNGRLPEVKENKAPLPEDPVKLGKLIESLKRNIRRNKQLAEKHPDNPIYPMKAKQYEEELQQVMDKLIDNEGTDQRR